MGSDEERLFGQGFAVDVERAEADEYWTHLAGKNDPSFKVPDYGRGRRPRNPCEVRDGATR
jgi:hypothetical protein